MKRFAAIALLTLLLGGCATIVPAPQATYTPLPTYTPYPTFTPMPLPTLAQVVPLPAMQAETPTLSRLTPTSPAHDTTALVTGTPGSASTIGSSAVKFVSVDGAPPNGTANVTVQAKPGASCSIQYKTPAGTTSTAQGLINKTADSNGAASWSWKIGSSTRPGKGTVQVTCDGQSSTSSITIQ